MYYINMKLHCVQYIIIHSGNKIDALCERVLGIVEVMAMDPRRRAWYCIVSRDLIEPVVSIERLRARIMNLGYVSLTVP